jgi:hypothetical protein
MRETTNALFLGGGRMSFALLVISGMRQEEWIIRGFRNYER